jgi:hypothetical protein
MTRNAARNYAKSAAAAALATRTTPTRDRRHTQIPEPGADPATKVAAVKAAVNTCRVVRPVLERTRP